MSDAPRKPPKLPSEPAPAGPLEPPEPPPREFNLKPTEYERVNRPADSTPGNKPIHVAQLYRAANTPKTSPAPPVKTENEIHAILRANLAAEKAKGLNEVIPTKRRSRRKQDYWLLLIGWNLLVGAVAVQSHRHSVTLVFCLSAAVFVSVALTWIMWGIMDDY